MYEGVIFENSFNISNYLKVDVLEHGDYFFTEDDALNLVFDEKEEVYDYDGITMDDSGFSSDILEIRRKVLRWLRLDQREVNTLLFLCEEFKIDRFATSFQGKFVLCVDTYASRVRELIDDANIPDLVISVPKEDVQSDVHSMGYVSMNEDGLFSINGRKYGRVMDRGEKWSDFVLDDYFCWLEKYKYDLSTKIYGYDDPLITAKWLPRTKLIAEEISRILPLGNKYYVPGDGVGIYSYHLKRTGHAVYSSEPNSNGHIARLLGLIDSGRPYNRKLDDGNVVLLAFNLGGIYGDWKGPFVSWEQDQSCDFGTVVPDTGGRLRIRGITLLHPSGMRGPSDKYVQKVRKKIIAAIKIGGYADDKVSVSDGAMKDLVSRAGFIIVAKKKGVLRIGQGKKELDVSRLQDKKTPNDELELFCNIGDLCYYNDRPYKVRQYGILLMETHKGFQRVRISRRESTYAKIYEKDGLHYMNSITSRSGDIDGICNGRRVVVRVITVEPEMMGYRLQVQVISIKHQAIERLKFRED